jgi:exosortase A-associated hydrolase 1
VSFTEQTILFRCAGEKLLGILAVPDQAKTIGILIIVGGPQTRVGSHRQFLLLSRALAEAGYPVMRFDYRGMGDSTGALRDFEMINEDIAAAIAAFRANCLQVERIVLWGLCDAASASLLYWDATEDPCIYGLVLLNPWVRSEATLARTQIKHYYGQRLLQAEFWHKLLTGKLRLGRALLGFLGSLKKSRQQISQPYTTEILPFQKRMLHGIQGFGGEVLILLSGNDYTAKEFLETVRGDPNWVGVLKQANIIQANIPQADHTFSSEEWQRQVENITILWLGTKVR